MASTVPPRSPRFFKIILPQTIASAKLKIPKLFVTKYGNTLSDSVYLKVPTGQVWQIDVMREEGEVSLHKRWTQFAEHYALEFGHMLVFMHEGNSTFSVVIFDKSATEIDYPSETIHAQEPVALPKTKPCNEDVIYFLSEAEYDANVRKSKRKRHEESIEESNHSMPDVEATSPAQGLEPEPEIFVTMKALTSTEKARALVKTSSFKTKNPNFKVVMQPAYIHLYKVYVPIDFAKKHFTRRYYNVILGTSDGRRWSVEYAYTVSKKKKFAMLSCGWKSFANDNSLGVGDVCVFELKEKSTEQLSFEVVIFRFTEDKAKLKKKKEPKVNVSSDSCDELSLNRRKVIIEKSERNEHDRGQAVQLLSGSEVTRALQEANKFATKNPSFVIFMSPGNTGKYTVSVRMQFVNKHLKNAVFETTSCDQECQRKKKVKVQLQVGVRLWNVNLLSYPSRSSRFCRGWLAFAEGNNLGLGDACVFELININNVVFKVTIFRCI